MCYNQNYNNYFNFHKIYKLKNNINIKNYFEYKIKSINKSNYIYIEKKAYKRKLYNLNGILQITINLS